MRKKYVIVILSILLLVLLASCATQPALEEGFDEPYEPLIYTPREEVSFADFYLSESSHGYMAMRHIKFMNDYLYGRTPFSYRELEAALWIEQELLAMGHPRENVVMQEFSWDDVSELAWLVSDATAMLRFFGDVVVREEYLSQNVVLTISGQSERTIIVGAHYDSLLYPGASDNASGTALLMESAQRMLYKDNYHTIVYVFFGAEEVGLLGAFYYLHTLNDEEFENIVFMINADVLFEGPHLLYSAGFDQDRAAQANAITRQIDMIAEEVSVYYDIELIAYPDGIYFMSDHIPFLMDTEHTVLVLAGLYYMNGNFVPRVFHSPRDCIHYINENWPGKAQRAMNAYSIFLERILLESF